MVTRPLKGVNVLELSTMIAGPFAGQLLGDLGADVVKLERPGRGELARELEPTVGNESFYYLTANRNKRSLALDITTDKGTAIFYDLIEVADVLLVNFPPPFLERYDLTYDDLSNLNPDLIYCAISAYGATGPYRDQPGIDTTVQALSGAMSMTRDADTPPMRSGVPMNDVFGAYAAMGGIMAALYNRDMHDAGGEYIDISLLDMGIAGLTTRATYSLVTEEPYPPFGRRHNYFAPEGVYEVTDGEVQLSVVTNRHWEWFCEALDAPELAADDRFTTTNDRVRNRDALESAIETELQNYAVAELVELLKSVGIPAAPVNDTISVWDDPQVQARSLRTEMEHPSAGTVETVRFPIRFDSINPEIDRAPPRLGEHSSAVLENIS